MAKYKVGDRVRIKKGLVGGNRYGIYFNVRMEQYCGKVFEIKEIAYDGNYYLNGCDSWEFRDEMIECKESEKLTFLDIDFRVDGIYKASVGSDIYIIVKDGKMQLTKDTALSTSTSLTSVDYEVKKLHEMVEEDGRITDRKVRIISDIIEGDEDLRQNQVSYFIGFQNLKNLIEQITDIYDPIVAVNILLKSDFYSVEE